MRLFKNVIGLLLGASVLTLSACRNDVKRPPNILFIIVDDLGWNDLGYTGSEFYETPHLDKLASAGTNFTNAYAPAPICSPSRAAILSGKAPARLHLTDYIPGNRHWGPHKDQKLASHPFNLHLALEEETFAEAFKTAGYTTFFAGKWHAAESAEFYPEHQGFDTNVGGNGLGHPPSYFSPYKNKQIQDGPEGEYLTDRLTDEIIGFMQRKKDKEQPFLAYLSYYTVHLPLQGKAEKVAYYEEKLKKSAAEGEQFELKGKTYHKLQQNDANYAAMVESMDENIGRVLQSLEDLGLDDNTIVVFTSDNGGMATSNHTGNIPTSLLPLNSGKGYLYEGGIRVPLIISAPETSGARQVDTPVIGTDLYPTLLDLAGIELKPEQHKDGKSLKGMLKGHKSNEAPIFWHFPHYSGGLGGRPSGAVRLGNYKLIEFFEDMHVELYKLDDDIGERNDLSARLPEKTEELRQLLHQWRKDCDAQMPFENPHYQE